MLAIIGGTGLYELAGMQIEHRIEGDTPFGAPSGSVVQGHIHGRPVMFLARHGAGHRLLPHEVNYRANLFALKRAGATMVLGVSAVGSLAEQAVFLACWRPTPSCARRWCRKSPRLPPSPRRPPSAQSSSSAWTGSCA